MKIADLRKSSACSGSVDSANTWRPHCSQMTLESTKSLHIASVMVPPNIWPIGGPDGATRRRPNEGTWCRTGTLTPLESDPASSTGGVPKLEFGNPPYPVLAEIVLHTALVYFVNLHAPMNMTQVSSQVWNGGPACSTNVQFTFELY
eukprot:COSAG02_NODE_3483_length_6667_cov_3.667174_2_plen_147_part_00